MNGIEAALRRASADLLAAKVRFALVGGLAVSARTTPRFTRDIDLAVAVAGDAEAERLVDALRRDGYAPLATVEQRDAHRLAPVRMGAPGAPAGEAVLDLLFASSGIEREVVAAAESLEIVPGLRVPVATAGHLLALKILSRDDLVRPQDGVDLAGLVRGASAGDLEVARIAVALIEARGYARGRRLGSDLADLCRASGR